MESIYSIALGLGVRTLLSFASHDNSKISGPLVGVWEGVVTLHFMKKRPSSFDPYIAYGVRMFIDFLVTESVSRMVLVIIWTALGMVLADVAPAVWRGVGLHRPWRRLRRDLYSLYSMAPRVPVFPRARVVRFSRSRHSIIDTPVTFPEFELEERTTTVSDENPPPSVIEERTEPTSVTRRRVAPGHSTTGFTSATSDAESSPRHRLRQPSASVPSVRTRRATVYHEQPASDTDEPRTASFDIDRDNLSSGRSSSASTPDHRDDYDLESSIESAPEIDAEEEAAAAHHEASFAAAATAAAAQVVSMKKKNREDEEGEERTPRAQHMYLPPTPSDSAAKWELSYAKEDNLIPFVPPPSAFMQQIPDDHRDWDRVTRRKEKGVVGVMEEEEKPPTPPAKDDVPERYRHSAFSRTPISNNNSLGLDTTLGDVSGTSIAIPRAPTGVNLLHRDNDQSEDDMYLDEETSKSRIVQFMKDVGKRRDDSRDYAALVAADALGDKERLEKERMEKEKMEKEMMERERLKEKRLEKERLEQEKMEKERLEEIMEKELEQERVERERLKVEKERLDKERLEKELEIERVECERLRVENERLQSERLEKERLEQERMENMRLEGERLEKEKLERRRLEKERLEKERLEKERLEKQRMEEVRLERERLEKERLEKGRLEQERLEQERLEKMKLEGERLEKERLEKEGLEKEGLEKERLEKDREKSEIERLERERLESERLRLANERLENERRENEERQNREEEEALALRRAEELEKEKQRALEAERRPKEREEVEERNQSSDDKQRLAEEKARKKQQKKKKKVEEKRLAEDAEKHRLDEEATKQRLAKEEAEIQPPADVEAKRLAEEEQQQLAGEAEQKHLTEEAEAEVEAEKQRRAEAAAQEMEEQERLHLQAEVDVAAADEEARRQEHMESLKREQEAELKRQGEIAQAAESQKASQEQAGDSITTHVEQAAEPGTPTQVTVQLATPTIPKATLDHAQDDDAQGDGEAEDDVGAGKSELGTRAESVVTAFTDVSLDITARLQKTISRRAQKVELEDRLKCLQASPEPNPAAIQHAERVLAKFDKKIQRLYEDTCRLSIFNETAPVDLTLNMMPIPEAQDRVRDALLWHLTPGCRALNFQVALPLGKGAAIKMKTSIVSMFRESFNIDPIPDPNNGKLLTIEILETEFDEWVVDLRRRNVRAADDQ